MCGKKSIGGKIWHCIVQMLKGLEHGGGGSGERILAIIGKHQKRKEKGDANMRKI